MPVVVTKAFVIKRIDEQRREYLRLTDPSAKKLSEELYFQRKEIISSQYDYFKSLLDNMIYAGEQALILQTPLDIDYAKKQYEAQKSFKNS